MTDAEEVRKVSAGLKRISAGKRHGAVWWTAEFLDELFVGDCVIVNGSLYRCSRLSGSGTARCPRWPSGWPRSCC